MHAIAALHRQRQRLVRVRLDRREQVLVGEMSVSPPAAKMTSPPCRPASSAGLPRADRHDFRVDHRLHADVAHLELALRVRHDGDGRRLAAAHVADGDFPLGLRDDRHRELFPRLDGLPVDA